MTELMNFDLFTASIEGLLIFITLTIIMVIFRFSSKNYPGFDQWLMSMFIYFPIFVLVPLRGKIPDFISIVLANIIYLFATHLSFVGMSRFFEARGFIGSSRVNLIIFATSSMLFSIMFYSDLPARYSLLFLSASYLLMTLRIAMIPVYKRENRSSADWFAVFGLSLSMLSTIYKAIVMLDVPDQNTYTESDPALGAGMVFGGVSSIFVIFSLLLLVTQRLVNELRQISDFDTLTGAVTRRKMEELAEYQINLSWRRDGRFSIMIFDLDYFKNVNDEFGHLAGDKVLSSVVNICYNLLRTTDTISRIGGEEFLVLLPDTSAEEAEIVASKLQKKLRECCIITDGDRHSITVTLSIGISSLKKGDRDIWDIVKRADDCLYTAKNNGRDQYAICL